jgi:NAD-dependent SIR2 family protein deacetylase
MSSSKQPPSTPISDDLSFSRPLTDHGTVGAVVNEASDISYDLSSGSESSESIVLDVRGKPSPTDITSPNGMELICSKSRINRIESEESSTVSNDDHDIDDHSHESDNFEHHEEEEPNLEKIASWIRDGTIKRILVLCGAGVSCSAGIPDFRTPGSGLYDNLEKYNLPYPEAVFDLEFYQNNPMPFIDLAKELWPGMKHNPTLSHSFVALLDKKGYLIRNYTQNIDGLEVIAGVRDEKLVECHGHFRTSSCIDCGVPFDGDEAKNTILNQGQAPTCSKCGGLVKPDIVFFGESLPVRFKQLLHKDLGQCDLMIVMGTSLKVAPVSLIPQMLKSRTPRVLFNRELVGDFAPPGTDGNHRDVFYEGDCDDSVRKLCSLLGWEDELLALNEETKLQNNYS